jgi:hypothetical protein
VLRQLKMEVDGRSEQSVLKTLRVPLVRSVPFTAYHARPRWRTGVATAHLDHRLRDVVVWTRVLVIGDVVPTLEVRQPIAECFVANGSLRSSREL